MTLLLSGTDGLSDVDGTAATPAIRGTDANTGMFFPAADTIAFSEGGVEAMRLDSAGNMGLGTTTPTVKLQVTGGSTGTLAVQSTGTAGSYPSSGAGMEFVAGAAADTDAILSYNRTASSWRTLNIQAGTAIFTTVGSERARIDSSGNLLVGTTSSIIGTANFGIALLSNGSINNSRNVNGSLAVMQVFGNAGEFRVYGNGTYATISDARIKENVVDATPKLQDLMNVRIVNYNIIGDDQKQLGVIAQELTQVFPSLVDNGESEEDTKAVRYSVFVPMLIKAMQEQQAIIESLTARVAQLEAK